MSTDSGKADSPFYAPIQYAVREELEAQRMAARSALLHAIRTSTESLYARYAAGSFADLPVLSGAEIAAEIAGHPPFGRIQLQPEAPIRAGLGTACLPRPIPIFWTQRDLDDEARLGARALWRAGLRPRGRSSDCLEGGLVTPGTLSITDALDTLDALALPVGPITSGAALEKVRDVWAIVQPQVLILVPDSLSFLEGAGVLEDVRAVALFTPDDVAGLSAPPRGNVYRVLSLPLVCTFLAGECEAHDGLHVAEDAVAVEILGPSGEPMADGRSGRLIVSTLTRSAAVLRFDTGMRATLDRKPCACGETHGRLRFG